MLAGIKWTVFKKTVHKMVHANLLKLHQKSVLTVFPIKNGNHICARVKQRTYLVANIASNGKLIPIQNKMGKMVKTGFLS